MKLLVSELNALKNSNIQKLISTRMAEFSAFRSGSDAELFGELCFCILTANFQAEKSIRIQNKSGHLFPKLAEDELALELRRQGHRFPNMRAKFICEARKHKQGLKNILESFESDSKRREWLVKNVKGLGMKEASHFLRNVGYSDCAIIDFHIVDKLVSAGAIEKPKIKSLTPKRYCEIEDVLKKLGSKTGLTQAELDLYLWYAETGKVLK